MKHPLTVAACNIARLTPAAIIACMFAYIAFKTVIGPIVIAAFFAVFWALSTFADIRTEQALDKIEKDSRHGKN